MRPWGPLDPNSAHQLWSRWIFEIDAERNVSLPEIKLNAARWMRREFGSVGRIRVWQRINGRRPQVVIEVEVEGPPANDPGYVEAVKRRFADFVRQGWGMLAFWTVEAKVLAGDAGDGKPPRQLVVMPTITRNGY